MADPSGNYLLLAKYIGQIPFTFNVDPASGALSGTIAAGSDYESSVFGQWDDANSHITFHDGFAGEILNIHFFDGYVADESPGPYIVGLAGTYHDFRINVAGGRAEFHFDSGGWYATRLESL
jgi:hypothetical protein